MPRRPWSGQDSINATALGVQVIEHHLKRARFFSTIELVDALEHERLQVKAGQIAVWLWRSNLVIPDELGYLPFSGWGGALLFHLVSKLYDLTSVVITTNLSFGERVCVFGDAKMTTVLLYRLTHRCHIIKRATPASRPVQRKRKTSKEESARRPPDPEHFINAGALP